MNHKIFCSLSVLLLLFIQLSHQKNNPFPEIDVELEHTKSSNFGQFNSNLTNSFEKIRNKYIDDLFNRRVEPIKLNDSLLIEKANNETMFSFISKKTKQTAPTLAGPEYLLDYSYVDILTQFPSYGSAENKPWSGYYWAHRYGMLSARYPLDSKNSMCIIQNNQISQWYTYRQSVNMYLQPQDDYTQKYKGQTYYNQYVNAYYSPSEKIDLLFGDPNFSLTNYMKSQGYQYMTNDDVPSWLGLCNGWSPASYLEPRAKKAVTITAYDNVTQITFLPDDLEALATLFYAQSSYSIKMVGNRCSDTSETSCVLMNAGVFAIVIANQIGLRKQNLIFEPKVDNEIWNYPAYSYVFQFYNPLQRTGRQYTYNLSWDMLISPATISSSSDTVFRKAAKSSSISYSSYYAGIRLCITYVAEDYPYHNDQVWDDTTGEYCYDLILALTSNFKIIDGFWDQDDIPTYVWTPQNKETISGPYDNYVTSFDGTSEDIAKIRAYAIYSSRSGTILKKVMEFLINESNKDE